jgi:single-strand DNA-binding protein
MSSVNKYIVVGYLGGDPDMQYTSGETAYTKFSVATNNKFTKKDGTKVDETDWHNVIVWGKQAEHCKEYLHKGSLVYVEGRHRDNTWEKDGVTHHRAELIADRVQFLGGKGGSGGGNPGRSDAPPPTSDDDIPF